MPDSDTTVTTAGENALGFRNRSENFSVHLDNATVNGVNGCN